MPNLPTLQAQVLRPRDRAHRHVVHEIAPTAAHRAISSGIGALVVLALIHQCEQLLTIGKWNHCSDPSLWNNDLYLSRCRSPKGMKWHMQHVAIPKVATRSMSVHDNMHAGIDGVSGKGNGTGRGGCRESHEGVSTSCEARV